MLERLQKIIAAAGVASRRAAETLITEGRVRVNGRVVTELGTKADASQDHIKVDDKLINPRQPLTYVVLNKPAGYVTTLSDPEGRPTVQDLLKGVKTRVYPVGRLDYNTEGLLMLTNDGDFAHLITHPRHEFPKTYLAKIKGVLDDKAVGQLEQGLFLADGKTAPAKVRKVRKEEANSWVEITIHEGRKRQVRRMLDHVGHSVIRLKRIRTGNLSLGDLPEGKFRHLTAEEVKTLRDTALKTVESGAAVRVYKPASKVEPPETPEERSSADVPARRRRDSFPDRASGQRRSREAAPSQDRFAGQRRSREAGPSQKRSTGQRRGPAPGFSRKRTAEPERRFAGHDKRAEGHSGRPGGRGRGEGRKPAPADRAGGRGVKRKQR